MTQNEFDWLQRLEKNIDAAWDNLTVREQCFIEDILERCRYYGMQTKISPKEWGIIAGISDKAIL